MKANIIALLVVLYLGACSTYTPPPIAPDEPVAELYGTGNFSMTSPVMDPKGCYQTNMRIENQHHAGACKQIAGDSDRRLGGHLPLQGYGQVQTASRAQICGHGLPGCDDTAPQTSVFQRAISANTERCHIEIFDETKEGDAQRLSVQRTEPRQKGFACIRF